VSSTELILDGLILFKYFKEPGNALVGFNSIGGFSTINHLHYQIFDVSALSLTKADSSSQKRHLYSSEA